jgi:hypothetical protein
MLYPVVQGIKISLCVLPGIMILMIMIGENVRVIMAVAVMTISVG